VIPHLSRQIMKVPGSKGMGMEEFIDDMSKLKRKYSNALPWKLRNLLFIKR